MNTAPAPNVPAPPGMCPGTAVLGGGGGSGGGDGDGNGQGGDGGGGGNGNGNGGNGDGKGAGDCGAGSGGGCPNPAHGRGGGTHAGDPIDPLTGRVYTIPQTDMPLVGPLVFALQRAYSSFSAKADVGLGFGWNHSLGWVIKERRSQVEISPPFGTPVTAPMPDDGVVLPVRGAGLLKKTGNLYLLTEEQSGFFFQFEPNPNANGHYGLTVVFDSANNAIQLLYNELGQLTQITDSAGRIVRVKRGADGHITCFEITSNKGRSLVYRRYEYDSDGNLTQTVDAEGRAVRHRYDNEHRLVEQVYATGRTVHFKYDRRGRCVESWVDLGGAPDPALDKDLPTHLADGTTKAKGMLHVKLDYGDKSTTFYDSRQTKRLDKEPSGLIGRASGMWVEELGYDPNGNVSAYGDPVGKITRFERDPAGKLLSVKDPLDHVSKFKYDDQGRLVESVDERGDALRYSYDATGNLKETWDTLGTLLRATRDARGLPIQMEMPNGAVTQWEHDGEGNLLRLTEPNGKSRRFEINDFGLMTAFTNEEGHKTTFHYDTTNALYAVTLPNGAVWRLEFDAEGRIVAFITPEGAAWKLTWGGYHCVASLTKPTGETLHFRYDWEGNLVRIINEVGEEHVITRDAGSRVIKDVFFDGREYRYKLDAAGRLVEHRDGNGQRTTLERDACGRVTARLYSDRTKETFGYDPVGRLTRSESAHVTCTWSYDARGSSTREVRTHAGRAVTIDSVFNEVGQRTALKTTTGIQVQFERDRMGKITAINLPGGERVERVLDALGREIVRTLPGGGHILSRYDSAGVLVERRMVSPQAAPAGPDWTGTLPPGTTLAEGFACSPDLNLKDYWTSQGDRELFEYDAQGRLLKRWNAATATPQIAEAYTYGGMGRVEEPTQPRSYGPGGQLLNLGQTVYAYDGEGRRTEKTAPSGDKTKYLWNGRGMLAAVILPSGTRVENEYDTQGRRALKRVIPKSGLRVETRYTWSGDDLIHEVTWNIPKGQPATPAYARTYIWDDDGSPLAHRDTVWTEGGPVDKAWVHYALGLGDMPSVLVFGNGQIARRIQSTIWGKVNNDAGQTVSTPLRFPGQTCDDETGLHYNRYRFYDPELGLYINPDPLGLQGGLGAYEYAQSTPMRVVDPDGLVPVHSSVRGFDDKGNPLHGTGVSAAGRKDPPRMHPIVSAAMPPTANGLDANGWSDRRPGDCGEPGALSDYIYKWQEAHQKELDPNNPKHHEDIRKCMQSINSVNSFHPGRSGASDVARAPCANCSQLLANLNEKWGGPGGGAIQPGHDNRRGDGPVSNFTPPHKSWLDATPSHSDGTPYKVQVGYPNP